MSGRWTGYELEDYVVGPMIGGGGMGEVYQAFPKTGGGVVAIKVLHPDYAQNPDFTQRFVREVRVMENLDHENIVPILNYGIVENTLFFTMRLISGPSLETLLQKQPLSPLAMLKILLPFSKGLAYLHSQGVIHRDIKPSNVFLERPHREADYEVFVGDFGLSKRPHQDTTITQAGSKVGTIEYMSPEAAVGDELDYRTDIYSLAACTYEMLLGVLPRDPKYANLSPLSQAVKPPRRPHQLNPAFPAALEQTLLMGLAIDRESRYQSVGDFLNGIHQAMKQMSDEERQTIYWVS